MERIWGFGSKVLCKFYSKRRLHRITMSKPSTSQLQLTPSVASGEIGVDLSVTPSV